MTTAPTQKYRRILLKLKRGSAARRIGLSVFAREAIHDMARQIGEGVSLASGSSLLSAGGNIFRGLSESEQGIERATAILWGLLAHDHQRPWPSGRRGKKTDPTRVQSAITMARSPRQSFEAPPSGTGKGRVVFSADAHGQSYFSTDTAAALCRDENRSRSSVEGAKVDGIYRQRSKKNPGKQAIRTQITYARRRMVKQLGVM